MPSLLASYAKYSGCGNSFVLIDNRDGYFAPEPSVIQALSHQGKVDGVILLCPSAKSDFRMRIFNADGSEAEMCGNGVRCLMRFISDLHPSITICTLETLANEVRAEVVGDQVRVEMPQPTDFRIHQTVEGLSFHFVNTGVPHAVIFVENLENPTWMAQAPKIRHHTHFAPHGANVNFVQLKGDEIWVRTYERGVEGETQACGTGATASALIAAQVYGLYSPIRVIPRSQEPLLVAFDPTFTQVYLTGPAVRLNLN